MSTPQMEQVTADKVEILAKELHEAGRLAVEQGLTQNPGGAFIEWDDSPERTKEGRRVQARHLLGRYQIIPFSELAQLPGPQPKE